MWCVACGTDRGASDADTGAPDTGDGDPWDGSSGDAVDGGGEDTSGGDATDAGDSSAPAGLDGFDRAAAAVRVNIAHWAGGAVQTKVAATLWSAEPPSGFAVSASDGPCRLSLGVNPFCGDGCADGLCTAPDVCTPWPENASAGSLTVSGASTSWTFEHNPTGYGSAYDGAVFGDDALITVSADGGAFPAFGGSAAMPPAIEADLGALDLEGPDPLVLQWTAPTAGTEGTRVLIRLMADRGQHGRFPAAMLECDVPDSGSFTIPEGLRRAYADPEQFTCGKCPASALIRYRRTRVLAGAHAVDLWAESELSFLLTPWAP